MSAFHQGRWKGAAGKLWHCPICGGYAMQRDRRTFTWIDPKTGEGHVKEEVCGLCAPHHTYAADQYGGLTQAQRAKKH